MKSSIVSTFIFLTSFFITTVCMEETDNKIKNCGTLGLQGAIKRVEYKNQKLTTLIEIQKQQEKAQILLNELLATLQIISYVKNE